MLRFVAGRPVSQVTEDFLAWACDRLAAEGKRALLLVWDNAVLARQPAGAGLDQGAQPPGEGRGRGADRGVLPAGEGAVAQRDRAEVGPRQAGDRRAGPAS